MPFPIHKNEKVYKFKEFLYYDDFLFMNEENKIYGGVYIWESKEHCEAYKAGEIFDMVMNSENHINPTSKDFGVLEAPTKLTS